MLEKLDQYGDILTTKEVREILGIGANSVYKLLDSGLIQNFKIGKIRKIPKWYLIDYIEKSVTDIHTSERET